MIHRMIVVAISSIFVASCATSAQDILPTTGKATLVARGDSGALVLVPLSTYDSVYFKELDGTYIRDMTDARKLLVVEPGQHRLICNCHVISGGLTLSSDISLDVSVAAGCVYEFAAIFGNGGSDCDVKMTPKCPSSDKAEVP